MHHVNKVLKNGPVNVQFQLLHMGQTKVNGEKKRKKKSKHIKEHYLFRQVTTCKFAPFLTI